MAPSAEFRPAEKKGEMFRVAPQAIGGETKPAVFTHASSRLIFHDVTIPDNGRLRAQTAVFETLVTPLVMEGGDADTNACFAGALLGAYLGYKVLPPHWRDGLRECLARSEH